MSACDKCTDDHPCEDCSQTQTFSGLKGIDALKDFCMWAFDDKINQEAVFIAHNYNKVGFVVVSLSGWFVVCVIVSVDNERNIEVS